MAVAGVGEVPSLIIPVDLGGGDWLDIRGGRGEGGWGEQGGWVEERRDWEEDRWAGGQKDHYDDWQGGG